MNRPWMPLYIADYLRDTSRLSTLEHGAYMLLIMEYWVNDGLPDNDVQLARIARVTPKEWRGMRDTLRSLFRDGWRHKRIDEEIEASKIKYERRALAGKLGGEAKAAAKQNPSNAAAMLPENSGNALPYAGTRDPARQPQPQSSSKIENDNHPALPPETPSADWLAGLSLDFVERLRQALPQGEPCRDDCDFQPIADLLADGCTEADVLAGIAAALSKATGRVHRWSYFAGKAGKSGFARIARDNRLAGPRKANGNGQNPPPEGPKVVLKPGLPPVPVSAIRGAIDRGDWYPNTWGPPPGAPGCLVPAKLAAELLAEKSGAAA